MSGSTGPNLGLTYGYAAHDSGWGLGGFNPDMQQLDTLVMLTVISTAILTPPGSPANGDRYIIAGTGTGAWSGHNQDIAVWDEGTTSWVFYAPKNGWLGHDLNSGNDFRYNGTAWIEITAGAQTLEQLTDVEITDVANGQVLTWNSGASKWENESGGGSITLEDLTDVQVSDQTNGQVLTWNSGASKWENEGIPSQDLSGLGDVSLSTPTNGEVLTYNSGSSKWENEAASSGTIEDLTDVQVTSVSNGQVLAWNSTDSKWENTDQSGGGGAITDTGAWSAFSAYTAGDVATDGGIAYLCFSDVSAPGGGLSVEGGATSSGFNSVGSDTISITTSGSNEIIVLLVGLALGTSSAAGTVSSVTSTHLSWTKRNGDNRTSSFYSTDLELWWAHSSAPLTSETINVDFSNGSSYGSLAVIAVTGCNADAPWDTNVGLPVDEFSTSTGTGSLTYSTTANQTLAFFLESTTQGNAYGGADAGHHPSGFTSIGSSAVSNSGGSQNYSYIINASVQTGVTVTGEDATNNYHVFLDALAANSSGNNHPIDDTTHWLPTQVVFTGDSGSGGVEGLVPAPAAGDAAAGKFLSAAGDWAVPSGSSGGLFSQVMSATPTSAGTGLTTWLNQGSSSVSNSETGICISSPTASGGQSLSCRTMTSPSTPYTITALIADTTSPINSNSCGIGWYDGSAKLHVNTLVYSSGWEVAVERFNSTTSFDAVDASTGAPVSNPVWLQITDDGTNVDFLWSLDGANFQLLHTEVKASSWLGSSGYANVVFFNNPNNGAALVTLMSWKQS